METSVLSADQRRAVAARPGEPVRLIDPATNRAYVLLPDDVYEWVRALLQADSPADAYPAIDRAFAAGWDDPAMADYDRYEDAKY